MNNFIAKLINPQKIITTKGKGKGILITDEILDQFLESSRLLLGKVAERNIEILELSPSTNSFIANINENYIYLRGISTPLNTLSSSWLANDKVMSKKALSLFDIPTPDYICFISKNRFSDQQISGELSKFLLKHKHIIAKPQNGLKSRDVFLEITSIEEAIQAYNTIMSKDYKGVLFEEFISGDIYRLLYVNGELVAALKREKGFILGNGKDDLENLLAKKNEYLDNTKIHVGRIKFDERLFSTLKNQGYTSLKDIPAKNEKIFTEVDFSNLETVTEVTSQVNKKLSLKIGNFSNKVGLGLAGVDVITEDISVEEKCSVIEINKEPGIDFHHYPDYGNSIDVADKIIDAIIKKYS